MDDQDHVAYCSDTDSDATTKQSNEPSVKVVPDSYDNNNITATLENYSRRGEDIVTEVPDTADDALSFPQVKLAPSVAFHCPSLVDECLFGSSAAINGESSKLSKPVASQDFASASHHGSLKVVGVTSKSCDSGYGSRDNKTMSLTNTGSEPTSYFETLKVSSQESEAPPESRMPVTSSLTLDDHTQSRPRFTFRPIRARRPLVLSSPTVTPPIQIPSVMNQYLRTYQQEGVLFLYQHYVSGTGALLCDDIGLGKTVQVIAFMTAILEKTGTQKDLLSAESKEGAFLIVCTGSAMFEWTSQLKMWSNLKYRQFPISTSLNDNNSLFPCVYGEENQSSYESRMKGVDVVLVTHEAIISHLEKLDAMEWLAVICDEVETSKIPHAQSIMAMNSLKERKRIGLTNVTLQSRLEDLWCVLNWANPGCLGSSQDFNTEFENPILDGRRHNSTKRQVAVSKQRQSELDELMKRWMLRRCKQDVADQLPKIDDYVLFCPLTSLQKVIYQELLATDDAKLVKHSQQPCDCYSGKERGSCCFKVNSEGVSWQKLGYSYTVLLTKCANHLGLLLPSNTSASNHHKDEAQEVIKEVLSKHPQFFCLSRQAAFLTLSDAQYCGKMKIIQNLLSTFKKDKSRVVLFSDSDTLLNVVENFVVSQGYVYSRIHGSTEENEVLALGAKFNSDTSQFILLISRKYSGRGLTLSAADRVVVFDPTWSSTSSGCRDEIRTFRIGRSQDVKIFKLVTEGTVDEMLYLRQVYKCQLKSLTLKARQDELEGVDVARKQKEMFGYSSLWPLRKEDKEESLSTTLLKKEHCPDAGVKAVVDVFTKESADNQVVPEECSVTCENQDGSARSAEAHSVGRESQMRPQRLPLEGTSVMANILDISDESDDIDSYEPKKHKDDDTLLLSAPSAETEAPTTAASASEITKPAASKTRRSQSQCSSKKQGGDKGVNDPKSGENKKQKKNTSSKGRPKLSASSRNQSRKTAVRSRRTAKGLQFEDEDDAPSPPNTTIETSSVRESLLPTSYNNGCKSCEPECPRASSTQKSTAASIVSQTTQLSASRVPRSDQSAETRSILQPSMYSYADHEMLDELFGGPEPLPLKETQQAVSAGMLPSASNTLILGTDPNSDCVQSSLASSNMASRKSYSQPNVGYSDLGLCSLSASLLRSNDKESSKLKLDCHADIEAAAVQCSDNNMHTRNKGVGTDEELAKQIPDCQEGTKTTSKTDNTVSEFNIDDLFGF